MNYADIHIHALCGVDDGPKDEAQMFAMVDHAYADGSRVLCMTPHYHPGYFGDNSRRSEDAFRLLAQYAGEKYPDLRLYLGNELRWSQGCISWLADGACRTLNDHGHVLVDFHQQESERIIIKGLYQLLSTGYTPVLAHAERYNHLSEAAARELCHHGVQLQLTAGSLLGKFGLGARLRGNALLHHRLAGLIASDAHDLSRRSPGLTAACRQVRLKYGSAYANALCHKNALALLESPGEKEL